jgi:hypothetical protein
MKQKEVSSKRNLIRAAPLFPTFPEKPSFTFEVAISVSCLLIYLVAKG